MHISRRIVSEVIDGCHRSKALYKHGIKTIETELENDRKGLEIILSKLSIDPVKLTEAPELDEKEYRQFFSKKAPAIRLLIWPYKSD